MTSPADRSTPSPDSVRSLERLAFILDSSIPLPFGRSIGVDGIIGLVPGVGDAIGAALSSWIVYRAWQLGAARSTLLVMLMNVAIETVVGAIPVIGDLFDFGFKANRRNVALLTASLAEPARTRRRSRWTASLIAAAAVGALILILAAAVALGIAIVDAISG